MLVIFVGVIGVVAVLAAAIALSAFINGWVLTYLWHWFAVPVFGFHELTIVQAIGIGLIIGFMTHRPGVSKKDSRDTDWGGTIAGLLSPFLALFFGYIVHLFM